MMSLIEVCLYLGVGWIMAAMKTFASICKENKRRYFIIQMDSDAIVIFGTNRLTMFGDMNNKTKIRFFLIRSQIQSRLNWKYSRLVSLQLLLSLTPFFFFFGFHSLFSS
jgi:hypothetical protein